MTIYRLHIGQFPICKNGSVSDDHHMLFYRKIFSYFLLFVYIDLFALCNCFSEFSLFGQIFFP